MATESSYTLQTPVTPPATGSGDVLDAGSTLSPFADFIGYGLLTPFKREAADFANGGGTAFLQSMIGQVLGTRASSDFTTGELPWRGEFGSLLHLLRHQNNDQVREELARVYVTQALQRWVPQVRLKNVTITRELGPGQTTERNVLLIRIVYDVIGLRQAGNEVLVPGLEQSIPLAA